MAISANAKQSFMDGDTSELPEYFSVDETQSDAYDNLAAGLAVQRSSSTRIPVPSQQPPNPIIDPELLTDSSIPFRVFSTEEDDDDNADLLEASGKAIRIPVPLDEAPRPSGLGDLRPLWSRFQRFPAGAVKLDRPQYVCAPLPGVTPSSLFGPATSAALQAENLHTDIMTGVQQQVAATATPSSSPSPTPSIMFPKSGPGSRRNRSHTVRMRALWQEYFDKTHQRHYYYNTVTKETVWQLPADYGAQIPASGEDGANHIQNTNTTGSSPQQRLSGPSGRDNANIFSSSAPPSSSKSPISFAVAGDDDDDDDDSDGGLLGPNAVPADAVSPRDQRVGRRRGKESSGRKGGSVAISGNAKRQLNMTERYDDDEDYDEDDDYNNKEQQQDENEEEQQLQPQRYYRQPLSELWEKEKQGTYSGFAVRDEDHLEVKDNNIVAGTLDKLIERLTHHKEHSIEFMYGFLLTFRAFTDPETVLSKTRLRYNTPPPQGCSMTEFQQFRDEFLLPVRLRICQVLKTWMKKHFYDFRRNSTLRDELEDFIQEINETGNRMTASTLSNCFRKNLKTRNTFTAQQMNEYNNALFSSSDNNEAPPTELPLAQYKKMMKRMREGGLASAESPMMSSSMGVGGGPALAATTAAGGGGNSNSNNTGSNSNSNSNSTGNMMGSGPGGDSDSAITLSIPLLEWPAVELARQLTLIDFEQFCMILSRECLIENLKRQNRSERAPNVDRMMQRTNTISHWVIHEVLRPPSAKARSQVLRKFIEIAYHCREIGNFHSAFIICGALLSNAVYRLRHTWEGIGSKHQRMLDELFELTDASQNFGKMRAAVQQVRPPSLPYLGMFIKDLLAIEEVSPDYVNNGLINFAKFRMLTRVVRDIKVYQQTPFVFRSVHEVREKLLNVNPPDSQTLYELSRKREGKKRKNNLRETFQNLAFSTEEE